jgi:type IV pilus assembly protein PilE
MARFLKQRGVSFVEVLLASAILMASAAAAFSLLVKQQYLLQHLEEQDDKANHQHNKKTMSRLTKGFSIIELLIALAILGIIGTLAVPSFEQQRIKTRRHQAQAAMLERMAEVDSQLLPQQHLTQPFSTEGYDVRVEVTAADAFQLIATAKGPQTKDSQCQSLILTHQLKRLPIQCWS